MMMMAMMIIVIVMILLINNCCGSDFDPYFLNCNFLKFFCMIRIFFSQFHHLIFIFLKIKFHGFSKLDALSLMTRVMS